MPNLKEIRKNTGLTQRQLATFAGVSFRTLQDYEQGYKDINKAQALTVYKIARVLGCKVEDLLEPEKACDSDTV